MDTLQKSKTSTTKADLVTLVANKSNYDKKDVEKILETFLKIIVEELVKTKRVKLSGFGTFYVAKQAKRKQYSPFGNKVFESGDCCVPKFIPSNAVKDKVKAKVSPEMLDEPYSLTRSIG
ncbi:HU family DNA-binding protein [Butyrivibrio hungatei]|uniref:DNA-binding protein n=1 Tax=Butyrivibrio hungatei TaxID=185008 RepID=A0A1D9P5V9_9FIRM|nr:HU family DNA-binding protein [Butyrivibrio hungatei]AOZ97893.1 DNA-binding protein [Butyrivibrio hungatei]